MFRCLYEKLLCELLFANRIVVLVTQYVELVLPAANYLVRMLDGRIDTQSPIQDLRAQGNTENITLEAADEVKKEELKEAVSPLKETKKPRELVKDEHREIMWSIYIRASPSLGLLGLCLACGGSNN
ncbi:hypothetical protein K443DRAFT_687035 [Laccaria amethystina LaAM-08-1]|uniref:Uncharacterized protein n=1 Tax=Laccaria amethystina LaAM-08-1 TaxID=1095629 RepID=A0A0C9X063_9AGAR|nr:hypothetical protein K443DRAFT_687035 [Laccaria amethystina LaAM-08-1]